MKRLLPFLLLVSTAQVGCGGKTAPATLKDRAHDGSPLTMHDDYRLYEYEDRFWVVESVNTDGGAGPDHTGFLLRFKPSQELWFVAIDGVPRKVEPEVTR